MNRQPPTPPNLDSAQALQARFARLVASALSEQLSTRAAPDIDERLRFARESALLRARQARRLAEMEAVAVSTGGAITLAGGPGGLPWWLRLGAVLPLAVLVLGLVLIESHYTRTQIEAAAEVDAALLADDLPPDAYRDTGFVEFLKTARQ